MCWLNNNLSNNKTSGGGYWMHRKWELMTWELSGGSRSGVEGEQKLCKPHTEQERGPRMHSLTPSLSVYTFLYMPPHVFRLSDNVFLHLFVKPKWFSICPPYRLRCHPHFSVHLLKTLFTIRVYSAECLGERTIQTAATQAAGSELLNQKKAVAVL